MDKLIVVEIGPAIERLYQPQRKESVAGLGAFQGKLTAQ
jgi:hypothetical protein